MNNWKPLIIVMLTLTGCYSFNILDAACATESTWKVTQEHRNMGEVTTYIAKNGIKMIFHSNDFNYSCYGPDWELLLYNEKQKIMERKPFSYWASRGIKTPLSLTDNTWLNRLPRIKGKEALYANHKALFYLLTPTDRSGKPDYTSKADFGHYIVSKTITSHPNAIRFAQLVFDSPPVPNYPLKLTKFCRGNSYGFNMKYNQEKSELTILSTSKVEKIQTAQVKPKLALSMYKAAPQSDIIVNQKRFSDFFEYMYDKDKKQEKKNR